MPLVWVVPGNPSFASGAVRPTVWLLVALYACGGSVREEPSPAYDIVIRGGTIVDGTGDAAFLGDVAIAGDRVVRIDRNGISTADAFRVIDAEGFIVAPGFVDNHAHVQTTIHRRPLAENFVRQGITTIIASLHSGDQPDPFDEYLDQLKTAPNVGFFAGHTWTRKQVIGLEDRAPTAEELDRMRALVQRTMEQGALGLSTGLLYVPANYADTEEVIELAKVAARYGGIYVSHMRDEARGLLASVAEVIRIAEEADIPAQINHHKAVGQGQWGMSRQSLAMIDSARARGLDVTLDAYPYTASSTSSAVLFPQWALAGGPDDLAGRLADQETRQRVLDGMVDRLMYERGGNDLSRVQFRVVPSLPQYKGKTLADLAADRGLPSTVMTGVSLVADLQMAGGFSAIYHSMDEADLIRILQHPQTMIETDGDPVGYGEGFPHPRSYGAFPRVLARYVRELHVLTLEQAIQKMTSMPARQVGQFERGLLREGAYADITIFDAETIQDRATYTDPHQYPFGIPYVIVNGVIVLDDGSLTGEKPGMVIRGPARN